MTIEEAISMLEQIGRHECVWMVCRHNEVYKAIDTAIEALKDQRPQGEWVLDKENSFVFDMYKCSKCGFGGSKRWHFCPNCGYPMISSNSEIEKSKSEIVPDYRDGWRKRGEAE